VADPDRPDRALAANHTRYLTDPHRGRAALDGGDPGDVAGLDRTGRELGLQPGDAVELGLP
jgi:hypothetical protein